MILKLVSFCCGVKTSWLIGDWADLCEMQGCGRVFAEVAVKEVLEGFQVRQCASSCIFILSLTDTFFDHSFKFPDVNFSRDNNHC